MFTMIEKEEEETHEVYLLTWVHIITSKVLIRDRQLIRLKRIYNF
jgi:hypothetical protein